MLIPVQPTSRGKITDELKAFYLAKTKRELTTRELRLLPFLLHCGLNNGAIPSRNVNIEEITILESLDEEGFIFYSRSGEMVGITEVYFEIICKIIRHSYLTMAVES